jgi:hypothetical protein
MASGTFIKEQKKIYVFGGICDSKMIDNSIEIYDI